ncbi:hypothetical protein LTR56_013520 [Elasticomyces elasticus]|nr:hypothetical protein LTR56_013520 [Elasticomyces elasticus]KAK3649537.1 hypothetical protein LTR22_012894 [Elasticomyces elasticus]KAK5763958.1 hypothetical protein LTS12_005868 [Elasticomyces elasticus]
MAAVEVEKMDVQGGGDNAQHPPPIPAGPEEEDKDAVTTTPTSTSTVPTWPDDDTPSDDLPLPTTYFDIEPTNPLEDLIIPASLNLQVNVQEPTSPTSAYSSPADMTPRTISPMPGSPTFSDLETPLGFEDAVEHAGGRPKSVFFEREERERGGDVVDEEVGGEEDGGMEVQRGGEVGGLGEGDDVVVGDGSLDRVGRSDVEQSESENWNQRPMEANTAQTEQKTGDTVLEDVPLDEPEIAEPESAQNDRSESQQSHLTELPAEPIAAASPPQSPIPTSQAPDPIRASTSSIYPPESEASISPLEHNITATPTSPTSTYAPSPPQTPIADPQTFTAPIVSPLTRTETMTTDHDPSRDSMASIALSDTSMDYDHLSTEVVEQASLATPRVRASRHIRKPSSLEILQNMWGPAQGDTRPMLERQNTFFDALKDEPEPSPTPIDTEIGGVWAATPIEAPAENVWGDLHAPGQLKVVHPDTGGGKWHRRTTSLNAPKFVVPDSPESEGMGELDWGQLDQEEEWEKEERRDGGQGRVGEGEESTAFLLKRLELENAKISSFSSSVGGSGSGGVNNKALERVRRESRPPSRGLLKRMISDRSSRAVRYSVALDPTADEVAVPEPPPMTELEFWAALVQDYPSTAVRLPTLTTTKIRAGIPPPLRGVVWQSMSGARDRALEEAFDTLQHESSPYEGIINKDVGRSFPGVELFKDAEGEGQKSLGRVLKCFSLHDTSIGYCQGLGFLVGPLLMNMGEREAFCVLVRLMEGFGLRESFLPSLRGLHMRIYQFSVLVREEMPGLWGHLEGLGVEGAYLSQWFLSLFAVTCPLEMLMRIYDVVFAEGAGETVMRVALALMRRNEGKMMGSGEFEEVMQLLLGRGIWECYAGDADALVDDFTSLGSVITHGRLSELEKEFEGRDSEAVGQSAGFLPDVQAAASRFLGRLWTPGHGAKASTTTLSPAAAEGGLVEAARKTALRKSPSKQSISTLNEASGSSSDGSSTKSGSGITVSTGVTEADGSGTGVRESQLTDAMSFKSSKAESMRTVSVVGQHSGGMTREEREMHGQIEDLLTALGEMQREQQGLVGMLQREREERGEDHLVVRRLVKRLRRVKSDDEVADRDARRRTLPVPPRDVIAGEGGKKRPRSVVLAQVKPRVDEDVDELVESVASRLETNARFSLSFETKAELRSKLTRAREQLAAAETSSSDLAARLELTETNLAAFTTEADDLRAEVKELRLRVNEEFKTRQKLEHSIRELKAEARVVDRKGRERLARADSMQEAPSPAVRRGSSSVEDGSLLSKRGSIIGAPGLRELRLVRRDSSSSVQSLRAARGQRPAPPEIHIQTQQPPASNSPPTSAVDTASSSPPPFPDVTETPVSTTAPPSALSVPAPTAMWHARTSSLAVKEVLATPEHEVVPDEALLLELVNAKTSEVQSRAEVDELKRALLMSNRRHEQMVQALQAQIGAANAVANAAKMEAQAAQNAAEQVRQEAVAMSSFGALSVPTTPGGYDGENRSPGGSEVGTPVAMSFGEKSLPEVPPREKSAGGSVGGSGGWFWNRRSPSTTKIAVTPPAE